MPYFLPKSGKNRLFQRFLLFEILIITEKKYVIEYLLCEKSGGGGGIMTKFASQASKKAKPTICTDETEKSDKTTFLLPVIIK
jgi:hypothetical protein